MKVKKIIKETPPFIRLVAFLIFGIVVLSTPSYAVPLDNWNVTTLNDTDDYVDVIIGLDGSGNTTLSVQWNPGLIDDGLQAIGIDKFAYNSTTEVSPSGCPSGWTCNLSNDHSFDGFGNFLQSEKDSGGDDGILSPIVFTLNGLATFTPNDNDKGDKEPGIFVAHVRYQDDCSGLASDGWAGDSIEENGCRRRVPEPSSLLLLITGITGLGLWKIRKYVF